MRRYWKILLGWTVVVFLVVLAATLPPLFVQRSESREAEMDRAMMEITNAGVFQIFNISFDKVQLVGRDMIYLGEDPLFDKNIHLVILFTRPHLSFFLFSTQERESSFRKFSFYPKTGYFVLFKPTSFGIGCP